MKKFLSLVLALVMTMSLVTVSAGAKDFTDNSKINYKEAVDVMSAAKVIDGYAEGDFRPSATLTRGAAAKIICNLILGPTTASALVADAAPYKDVPTNHTFAGYIAYCQKEGIISGYADGTFRPAASLTGYAFMKMLLGALGYDAEVEQYTGANWSINVAKRALNIGLDDDLVGEFNGVKAVNREEACLYALNTLTADMVEYDAKTTVSTNGTTVVIAGSKAKEMVNNGNTDGKVFDKDGVMQFAEKYFDNLTVKTGSDDFSRPANVWKLKAEEIGTYTNTPDATYTKKVENGDIYKDLGLGSKIEAKDVSVYEDGVKKTNTVAIEKGDDTKVGNSGNGVLTEVFYDDDADTVTVTQINTYVGSINKTVKATDKKDAYVVVTAEGPVPSQGFDNEFETDEKFEDDAYVLYTYSLTAKEIKSVEAAKKVEGTVTVAENSKTDLDEKKALTIDGTRYKAAVKVGGEDIGEVSVKQDYTIYLDSYGYMIYVEENEEIGDYALVLQTAAKSDFVGKKAELLFTDGTTKTVTTEKNYHEGTNAIADNTIVTYKVDSDGVYTLREVASTKASYVDNSAALNLKNDKAGIGVDTKTINGTSNNGVVTANSATVFVVRDTDDTDDYTAYTGIKNAPTINTTSGTTTATKAGVYYYCKTGKMVTVMFIMPGANVNVEDESSNALFIAVDSVDNLIHDNDGDYYVFNAVINGEIKTVKVDQNVKVVNAAGVTTTLTSAQTKNVDGLFKGYSVDKYGIITTLRAYDAYSANTDKKVALTGVGIDKVSKEYTVKLDTANVEQVITCDDNMKVYYVDEDGNISESSYGAIAVDSNDRVYAVVQDYLVKTLVICEVPAGKNPGAPTSYTFDAADASVTVKQNKNSNAYSFKVEPAEFVPAGATLTVSYNVLIDGFVVDSDSKTATVANAGEAVSFNVRDTSNVAGDDETVTVKITNVTTDKVSVKYVNGDTNGTLATSSAAKTVKVGTADYNFKFTIDTSSTDTSLKYSVTGLKTAADNVTKTAFSEADNAEHAIISTTGAKGDAYVVVTVYGLKDVVETYTVTELTGADIEGAANDKLTISASKTTSIAAGTLVTFTAKLGAAAQDAASYTVTAKINGKTYTVAGVADTTGKDLCTIAVNGNITVKADDVTVVAVPKLAVKSASWTANTVVINFNDGELGAKADKATSYTAPTGGSIAAVEVSGNTVTLTIADVLVAAGSTVKVGIDAGLATETTITMAADGTGTIA